MDELAAALTDLVLGLAIVGCALALQRRAEVHRSWKLTFWFASAGALAGAVHHGVFRSAVSWAVVGVLIVIAISYYLLASAREVLAPRGFRYVVIIRLIGLVAYGIAVIIGHTGLPALLICESVTMASILGLWLYAWRSKHPMAIRMAIAICANGLAGIVFALPESATSLVGLDSTALSHLGQIPGMVLLYLAIAHGARARWLR